jgi:hypothetical protein
VILVAHGGLSGLGTTGGLFRRAPLDQVFRVHLWHIVRADIPPAEEERRQWLLDCWKRIDDWVTMDLADQEAAPSLDAEEVLVLGDGSAAPDLRGA